MGQPELGGRARLRFGLLLGRRLCSEAGILRLREPLALPRARFAQDDTFDGAVVEVGLLRVCRLLALIGWFR